MDRHGPADVVLYFAQASSKNGQVGRPKRQWVSYDSQHSDRGSRDVTMSGVIRFALAQLAATKTPEEVAKSMLAGDTALRRPGRRRL